MSCIVPNYQFDYVLLRFSEIVSDGDRAVTTIEGRLSSYVYHRDLLVSTAEGPCLIV